MPAVVLAAVGFIALQKDRLLIRQQASEEANQIARQAVQVQLPAALKVSPPHGALFTETSTLPPKPEDELIFTQANHSPGWVAFLVYTNGDLIYPVPEKPLLPASLDLTNTLTDAQREAWLRAEDAVLTMRDATGEIEAIERFIGQSPPQPFKAQAIYNLGVLLARVGQTQEAREHFQTIRREFPDALSKTGIPLALYANLHLLELLRDEPGAVASRNQLFDWTCALAVLRFPVLAPAILSQLDLEEVGDSIPRRLWRKVLESHSTARRLYAASLGKHHSQPLRMNRATPTWLELEPSEWWLLLAIPSGSEFWMMALPEAKATTWISSALGELVLPPYFSLQVTLAGKPLSAREGEELAVASLRASADEPEAQVRVFLRKPELLYARQRTRTKWFGMLIGLCTLTMVVGLVSARRAFVRQLELTELKSNFVSSISHELRSPIASVRLMAEELVDVGEVQSNKIRDYHGFIVQECRRLSALIENVLDFSRHEQGRKEYQFELTDARALVEATVKLMRIYGAEKQIAIVCKLQGDEIEIEADGRALQQVLVNLIDNAIKHSPAGSTITVGASIASGSQGSAPPLPASSWSHVKAWLGANHRRSNRSVLHLWVEDQGAGIPREEQKRIFDRFYRLGTELRRETQGVGLGLAIVKYITEAHGGRVEVRSEVGQGSRFTVELPLSPRGHLDSKAPSKE